jgi:hypothetical protein
VGCAGEVRNVSTSIGDWTERNSAEAKLKRLRFAVDLNHERKNEMSQEHEAVAAPAKQRKFSIDAWAVLLAFALAALVRAGVFKHIPW